MRTFIIGITVTLIIGWASLIGLYLFHVVTRDPIVYAVQPFSIDKDVYNQGDTMIITSYRCNNEGRALAVETVERYFYNIQTGEKIHVPSAPGVVQAGCSWQHANVYDGFPEEMSSGYYIKRGITRAQGRFKTIDVSWQTEPFWYIKE